MLFTKFPIDELSQLASTGLNRSKRHAREHAEEVASLVDLWCCNEHEHHHSWHLNLTSYRPKKREQEKWPKNDNVLMEHLWAILVMQREGVKLMDIGTTTKQKTDMEDCLPGVITNINIESKKLIIILLKKTHLTKSLESP